MKRSKNYLFLMVALIVSLFLCTFPQSWATIFVAVFFLLSIVVAAYSVSKSRIQLSIMLGLSAAAVMPLWEIVIPNKTATRTLNDFLWLALVFYVALAIFRDIVKARQVSSNEIYGAISVYLLMGIFFGIAYQILVVFDPGGLYFNPVNFTSPKRSDGDFFYYSFVTLSTVGYGDVSPVAPIARSISMIEAILGVMYVATMIARFIAIHTNSPE
jgi:voltage-gated potassium channel